MSGRRITSLLVVTCALACVAPPAGAGEATAVEQVRSLVLDGEYDEAHEAAHTALEERGSVDDLPTAELLDLLLEAGWRSGRAGDTATRAAGERALAIKTRLAPDDGVSQARTHHHLGVTDYFRGELDSAEREWTQAAELRRAALGPEHADVAESLNALANLYQVLGRFDDARSNYEEAVRIRERALGAQHSKTAQSLNNLGALLTTIGDYAAALPVMTRSLEIKQATLDPGHPQIAASLSNLGDLYDLTGESERALEHFSRAAAIWKAAHGPEHTRVAVGLNNIAEQHRHAGRLDQAEPLLERALAIWQAAHGPEHHRVALASNNLALLLDEAGEPERAAALHRRALAIREAELGESHPEVGESLAHLGDTLLRLDRPDEALPAFERSVEIQRAALGDEHPLVIDGLLGLGRVHATRGRTIDALHLALEAERIGRDHLRLTGRTLSEAHAARYAARRRGGLDLALHVSGRGIDAERRAALFDAIVRSRAVVLDEIAARHGSLSRADDPQVSALARDLADARRRLANLTVRGLGDLEPDVYRGLLDAARERKERVERALAAASAEFALERARTRIGGDEVSRALPAGSALVAFVLHDGIGSSAPRYTALVLRAGGRTPSLVPLGEVAGIDAAVAAWKREAAAGTTSIRRTVVEAETAYRAAGERLRRLVWDPLAPNLSKVRTVFVVPDGALNLISFAALPTAGSARRYLVESGPTIHYLSAERDLVVGTRATGGARGLLAVGAPDYDVRPGTTDVSSTAGSASTRSAGCGDFESLRFDPLPAAELEAREIAELWRQANGDGSVVALHGPQATETAFARHAPDARVIHLATHGFFLGGDCMSATSGSRGLTITSTADAPRDAGRPAVGPLLLSGLALAGANRRADTPADRDDGVLTAEEIAGLDLTRVEWAVLSACDTGVGEVQAGEGVFGLRRAVQLSGVRTLIMSLWPVDDAATRAWMRSLYRARLLDDADTASAVRRAGRSLLRARRRARESTHPFYWGAFVAAGDWR